MNRLGDLFTDAGSAHAASDMDGPAVELSFMRRRVAIGQHPLVDQQSRQFTLYGISHVITVAGRDSFQYKSVDSKFDRR